MKFANVEITADTIQRTRQHFADNCDDCIRDAENGVVFVNNLATYRAWVEGNKAAYLAGGSDHTFTFLQRAYWLQTGECVPLLSS